MKNLFHKSFSIIHNSLFIILHLTKVRYSTFSFIKGLYIPKDFINHAMSLRQAFAHCGRFSTAASRRSLGSVAVPVRGVALSRPLSVVALVSRYLTNKLMEPRPLPKRRKAFFRPPEADGLHPVLVHLSVNYSELRGRLPGCYAPVCH